MLLNSSLPRALRAEGDDESSWDADAGMGGMADILGSLAGYFWGFFGMGLAADERRKEENFLFNLEAKDVTDKGMTIGTDEGQRGRKPSYLQGKRKKKVVMVLGRSLNPELPGKSPNLPV